MPPVVTEPVGEAAPTLDAAEPAPVAEEAGGTKRKFEEAADGPDAGEEEHLHKRVVLEPEVGATTSAEARPLCVYLRVKGSMALRIESHLHSRLAPSFMSAAEFDLATVLGSSTRRAASSSLRAIRSA